MINDVLLKYRARTREPLEGTLRPVIREEFGMRTDRVIRPLYQSEGVIQRCAKFAIVTKSVRPQHAGRIYQ
jgi:hypothetical protein